MKYKAVKKGTLYGVAGYSEHLILLCSDPVFYRPYGTSAILSVNVTTWKERRERNDPTCILNVGDHDFIKHKSFCFYEQAVPLNVARLEERVNKGQFLDYGMLKEEVFKRVFAGFYKTPFLSQSAIDFLKLL